MVRKTWLRLGFCLVIIAALFCGVLFPASAAGAQPELTVIGVVVDSKVQIQAFYLPPKTEFKVRMGVEGSLGVGGPVVANIMTNDDGVIFAWVEILKELRGKAKGDLRLEGGGISLVTTFDNSEAKSGSLAVVVAPVVVPVTGHGVLPVAATSDTIRIDKVQKGGIVKAAFFGIPKGVEIQIFFTKVGEMAYQGYHTGGIKLSSTSPADVYGTFEIPAPLRDTLWLDLHAEGPGYMYVVTFKNADL
jgi:hypothetical protein